MIITGTCPPRRATASLTESHKLSVPRPASFFPFHVSFNEKLSFDVISNFSFSFLPPAKVENYNLCRIPSQAQH